MSSMFSIILIAISLSMDAFSLALCYGTLNISKKKSIILSLIVGIFHFIMPFIGLTIGNIIINNLVIDGKYIILIILSFIGIDMILSTFKKDERKLVSSLGGMLVFAFSVSLDSFSTGVGLNLLTDRTFESLIIFSIISASFTLFGMRLGNVLNKKYGDYSTIFGGIVLIILGVYFFVN